MHDALCPEKQYSHVNPITIIIIIIRVTLSGKTDCQNYVNYLTIHGSSPPAASRLVS